VKRQCSYYLNLQHGTIKKNNMRTSIKSISFTKTWDPFCLPFTPLKLMTTRCSIFTIPRHDSGKKNFEWHSTLFKCQDKMMASIVVYYQLNSITTASWSIYLAPHFWVFRIYLLTFISQGKPYPNMNNAFWVISWNPKWHSKKYTSSISN
jgi:hypothetical protein